MYRNWIEPIKEQLQRLETLFEQLSTSGPAASVPKLHVPRSRSTKPNPSFRPATPSFLIFCYSVIQWPSSVFWRHHRWHCGYVGVSHRVYFCVSTCVCVCVCMGLCMCMRMCVYVCCVHVRVYTGISLKLDREVQFWSHRENFDVGIFF